MIKQKIRPLIFNILSIINKIFPKNEKRIFFNDSVEIKDNQYIFFEFLIKNKYNSKYKIKYFTKNINQYPTYIVDCGSLTTSTIYGLYCMIRSKYVINAYGQTRFYCKVSKNQICIELWHGYGLKKIGYSILPRTYYNMADCFSHVIIPSELFCEMIKKSWDISKEQIVILGSPRNDLLLNEERRDTLTEFGINRKIYQKIIYFLPTYRNTKRFGFTAHKTEIPIFNENNIVNINDYLKKNSILLIIKLHHAASNEINFLQMNYSNIIITNNRELDTKNIPFYTMLAQTDALITDYSSVFQDYLLINKPIGFVVDDLDDYLKVRGMNFENPLQLMPGHHIYNESDLYKFFDDIVIGNDPYISDREKLRPIFNKYLQNGNCRRLAEFMELSL